MRTLVSLLALLALLAPASAGAQARQHPFAAAAERTRELAVYRMSYVVRARGVMADPLARIPPATDVVLSDVNGLFVSGNIGLSYRAADAVALGFDRQRGLDLLLVDGISYAIGPLPVPRAYERRWYNLGTEPPSPVQPPADARAAVGQLSEGVVAAGLRRVRFEQLDGVRCAVYRGGAAEATVALVGLGRPITGERDRSVTQQMEDVKLSRADYQAWVCDDGYIHQIRVTATGAQVSRPGRRFSADIQLRISEIGSRALKVEPPPESLLLKPAPPLTTPVLVAGDVRESPQESAPALGQLRVREVVQLLDRTEDSRWFRVRAQAGVGWVPVQLLRATVVFRRVPALGAPAAAGPITLPTTAPTAGTPAAGTPTAGTPTAGTPVVTPTP